MRSSSGAICIAASAQKLDVDNRISLRYYYRIADNLLKQADIFREEKNVTDLYIMLLRFSSLIAETIPYHQDYQVLLLRERNSYKKKLLNALTELEALKPLVQKWLEELNRKCTHQVNREDRVHQNFSVDSSLEWPPTKNQTPTIYDTRQVESMASSYSISSDYVPKCACGEMICLTSRINSNPNRKFWRCPNWKDKKGCGRFIWKDEVDSDKNVAVLMEDTKKTMDKLSEIICVAVEEMRHVAEERKKINKFLSVLAFVSCVVIVICMMKNV